MKGRIKYVREAIISQGNKRKVGGKSVLMGSRKTTVFTALKYRTRDSYCGTVAAIIFDRIRLRKESMGSIGFTLHVCQVP